MPMVSFYLRPLAMSTTLDQQSVLGLSQAPQALSKRIYIDF